MRSLVIASAILLSLAVVEAGNQTITVSGITACNKRRVQAEVTLWEQGNEKLASMMSSKEGFFEIRGSEDEKNSFNPYLIITHTCNVKKKGCKRTSRYPIPRKYIGGRYEMTYVSLDIVVKRDKEKC
uniref:Transthyretin-like family protein n=1 Tax=Caenorhabditis japonica TaxID=281687 RepID=A0A8R1HK88_CAEJA